jgi:hypothetical protein
MERVEEEMKRLVIISDLHCGHRAGLTPPGWQYQENQDDHERNNFGKAQREIWNFYSETIDSLKPIDIIICNGDAIDGKGERSGGTEQLESDRTKQVEIAAQCINYADAKAKIIIYGTQYHTGKEEDFEKLLGEAVGAYKVGGHEWLDVNGLIFDFKHFISSSIIPHGRYTAIARDALWNKIWSMDDMQPNAEIIIRSHVHYHRYAGEPGCLMMTTPALQGFGSKFGVRMCSGRVDVGFVHFDVEDDGGYSWRTHLLEKQFLKVQALSASTLISDSMKLKEIEKAEMKRELIPTATE